MNLLSLWLSFSCSLYHHYSHGTLKPTSYDPFAFVLWLSSPPTSTKSPIIIIITITKDSNPNPTIPGPLFSTYISFSLACHFLVITITVTWRIRTHTPWSLVHTCVAHELAGHLLIAAAATEDLATDTTVVTAPERIEFVAAFVTFSTFRIRHPVLLEVGITVSLWGLSKWMWYYFWCNTHYMILLGFFFITTNQLVSVSLWIPMFFYQHIYIVECSLLSR